MNQNTVTLCFVVAAVLIYVGSAAPQVPCFFVFGDSLADNGNNNNLTTIAKANYAPYGIDYPNGATGRFCNGKTTVDIIAEQLGFEDPILSYATATGNDILRGVNYASGAAGIRDETGQHLGDRLGMWRQLRNYETTKWQLSGLLGGDKNATDYLGKCVYSVGLGSNDYLNNYFLPLLYPSKKQYSPIEWAQLLTQTYSQQLKKLYEYGARKIAVAGVAPIGCTPNELAMESLDGKTCVAEIDKANQMFNRRLKLMVVELNHALPGAKFVYVNIYDLFHQLISRPAAYGFKVADSGCCGFGRNNGELTCLPTGIPCDNRREYVFWDAYHPTEAANTFIGQRAYRARSATDVFPYDIKRLATL